MTTNCEVVTDTIITNGSDLVITCKPNLRDDGKNYPDLYKVDLLTEPKIINSVSGKEGELLAFLKESESEIHINERGELITDLKESDSNYYIEATTGQLKY